MPDEVYDAVSSALDLRLAKGVKRSLALLPQEMRKAVTTTALPKEPDGLRGLAANVMIVEEVHELTDAEAAALAQHAGSATPGPRQPSISYTTRPLANTDSATER